MFESFHTYPDNYYKFQTVIVIVILYVLYSNVSRQFHCSQLLNNLLPTINIFFQVNICFSRIAPLII